MAGRSSRGLGDVLDYFIPEDEQSEARARARARVEDRSEHPTRWAFVASPERLLHCALAVELAGALARSSGETSIVATFAPHPLLPSAERARWQTVSPSASAEVQADALAREIASRPLAGALIAVAPQQLSAVLGAPEGCGICGLVLPVDASSRGLSDVLSTLRNLGHPSHPLRLGVVFVGSGEPSESLFRRLEGATRRQLGLLIEALGTVERESSDFRSLLAGRALVDAEPEAKSSRALARICERLRRSPTGVHA